MENKKEHPVWKILRKERYITEFQPKAEAMYDFIKALCEKTGDTTMKVFFNMWNEYNSETFCILNYLVNNEESGVK